MPRTQLDRDIENLNLALQGLRSIFHEAKTYGHTHPAILDAVSAFRERKLAKAPRWARAEFSGYSRARFDALHDDGALIFGGFYKGVFCSTDRRRPDYYEAQGISPGDYADDGAVTARGHYWTAFANGAKPFFLDAR